MPAAANFKHEVSVGLSGGPLLYPHKKQCCQLVPQSETVWSLMLPSQRDEEVQREGPEWVPLEQWEAPA